MANLKYYNSTTSQWETLVIGAKGELGPTGPTGPTGPSIDISGKANLSGGNTFTGNQVFNSGIITMPAQPVFQVSGATSGVSDNIWIFNEVYANIGNYYSTSTGRFTAPIAGVYFFWWSNIGGTDGSTYRYRIRKNNVNVDNIHLRLPSTSNYSANGTMTVAIPLSVNDFVNIFFESDSAAISFTAAQFPLFGGYLIG